MSSQRRRFLSSLFSFSNPAVRTQHISHSGVTQPVLVETPQAVGSVKYKTKHESRGHKTG